ncbi:uncharacterized protein FYW49_012378 [Xenentodon cancila]
MTSDKPQSSSAFPASGKSEQTFTQFWEGGQSVQTVTVTWQGTETEYSGAQTFAQSVGQPLQDLGVDAQQQRRTDDQWPILLQRHPSFPSVPPPDFVKQPAKLSLAKQGFLDRLLQPALTQQDDWFLYFDRVYSSFSPQLFEKPASEYHLRMEKQGMPEAEQETTTVKVIERLQETVTLVDNLREVEVLESRIREVRDLEGRLQEVDEMAEKLQKVIEEELGKEEVDKLREEERDLEQEQRLRGKTEVVERKSVRMMETEGDDLDEQIKKVFLKGLLSEEEEEQEGERMTQEGLIDERLREKLRQMEKEWQEEVEEKFDSPDVAGITSVVAFQKVEHRTKKKVTIVGEKGPSGVTSETGELEEERTWTEASGTRQAEDQMQYEDDWFKLFYRPPHKAMIKPPVTGVEKSEYFSYKIVETTEVVVEEKQPREKDVWHAPEILQQPSFVEVVDDWSVLLDVSPRESAYVPPVTLTGRAQLDDESCVSVVGVADVEKVLVEERRIIQETPRYLEEAPQQSVADRDDDWFVLLDVPSKETTYVPPVIPEVASLREEIVVEQREKRIDVSVMDTEIKRLPSEREDDWFELLEVPVREAMFVPPVSTTEYAQAYQRESISAVAEVQAVESRREVVVDKVVQMEDEKLPEQKKFQPAREREDDWLLLLDVVSKETSYVPPVYASAPTKIYPDVPAEAESVEQRLYPVDVGQVRAQDSQPPPVRQDDWFILFDAIREKPVATPAVTPAGVIRDVKKMFEVEVTGAETRTYKTMNIGVDSRQVGTGISGIGPGQIPPQSEREGEDDWCVLFDVTREKPPTTAAGTSHCRSGCRPRATNICSGLINAYVPVSVAAIQPVVEVAAIAEPKPELTVEDVRPPAGSLGALQLRKVDDWFVLLDVPAKVTVAADERVGLRPEVRPAKEFRVPEQRFTIAKEAQQQRDAVQSHPALRKVEDDWFVLLDVAPKKAGIFHKNVVQLHMQTLLAESLRSNKSRSQQVSDFQLLRPRQGLIFLR